MIVKQSTAASVTIGPILDADGVAKTDEVVDSILASKNGGAPAALDGSATLTHRHTGNYTLTYTANDSDTVGTLEFTLSSTTNAMPIKACNVVEEAIYAQLFASGAVALPTAAAVAAIPTTAMRGTDGANTTIPDAAGTAPTAIEIADAVLIRGASNIEGTADKHSLGAVIMIGTNSSVSGGTLTAKKPSDDTTFDTYTVTTDEDADPITGVS